LHQRGAPKQIVTGNIIKIGYLDNKIKAAFPNALFIVGKQCLRNPEALCNSLLAKSAFLAQQRDDARKMAVQSCPSRLQFYDSSKFEQINVM